MMVGMVHEVDMKSVYLSSSILMMLYDIHSFRISLLTKKLRIISLLSYRCRQQAMVIVTKSNETRVNGVLIRRTEIYRILFI